MSDSKGGSAYFVGVAVGLVVGAILSITFYRMWEDIQREARIKKALRGRLHPLYVVPPDSSGDGGKPA